MARFLASLPRERAGELSRVRAAILKRLPEGYEEQLRGTTITYEVPLARYPDTYNGHPLWLAALAAPKSYLTLHLMPVYGDARLARQLQEGFDAAGKTLDMGKACIHFTSADDLALDAIGDIISSVSIDAWIATARRVRRGARVRGRSARASD